MRAKAALKTCALCLSPVICALLIYLCRVLALLLLSALFGTWNLNTETYAYAPAWARAFADASAEIAQTAALLPVFTVSTVFVLGHSLGRRVEIHATRDGVTAHIRRYSRGRLLADIAVWVLVGAAAAASLLGILLLLRSARLSHVRYPLSPAITLNALTHVFAATVCAASARELPKKGDCAIAALAASVLGQCVLGFVIYERASAIELVNSALFGAVAYMLYDKRRSALYEICAVSAFRIVSMCVFGFGSVGLFETYTVSEAFLTGDGLGFAGAFATTVFLLFTILFMLYSNAFGNAVMRLRKKVLQWHKKSCC